MFSVQKKKSEINLMPKEGFSATTFGRILLWILSSFRIIVIVTEIIVMLSFLSRFWLDANNTDLNEELQQKTSIIAARELFENDFRDVQKRLIVYSELTKNEGLVHESLVQIVESLPPDVLLDGLEFRKGEVSILGLSPSERSVQQFIVNLRDKETFKEVEISDIQTNLQNASLLEFTIKTKT